jgi:hypothetical protein
VSIDVFLDETSRGLRGNLALVLEGPSLDSVRDPKAVLTQLSGVGRRLLPDGYRTPLTLRYRLPRLSDDPGISDTEFRFKLYVPKNALQAGHSAVVALATSTATAFRGILRAPDLRPLLSSEEA